MTKSLKVFWHFKFNSISTERHRAEVRRAYSDDRLAIVAERYVGFNFPERFKSPIQNVNARLC